MDFVILIKPGFQEVREIVVQLLTAGKDFKLVRRVDDLQLDLETAGSFYLVHKDRPFYNELVKYMISEPITALRMKGSIEAARDLIGATDPLKASAGSIRALFGQTVQRNVVHCSDSEESGTYELKVLNLT